MMKMRQQLQETNNSNMKLQEFNYKAKGLGTNNNAVNLQFIGYNSTRDNSPVSVISHSATAISQPSSACASMEHHLLINPNPLPNYPPSMINCASTSDDDSSAYNLPTLFFEVDSLQKEELAQRHAVSPKKFMYQKSKCHQEQDFPDLVIKKRILKPEESNHTITANFCSNGEHAPAEDSIEIQGLEEKVFLKANAGKVNKTQARDGNFARLKQHPAHIDGKVLTEDETMIKSASKVVHFSDDIIGDNLLSIGKGYEIPIVRKPSFNPTKSAGVCSKWDDAEKWLSYDNHNAKNSSRQVYVHTPNRGKLIGDDNTNTACIGNVKCANNLFQNSTSNHTLSRRTQYIDGTCRGSISSAFREKAGGFSCTSPSDQKNWITCGVNVSVQHHCVGDYSDLSSGDQLVVPSHTSNIARVSASDGEIRADYVSRFHGYCGRPPVHFASKDQHDSSAISQVSLSNYPIPRKQNTSRNGYITLTPRRECFQDNLTAFKAQQRIRHADLYFSSGELVGHSNNCKHAPTSTSDGELRGNYASDEQYKTSAKYTNRFRQHQILQKLRRKCAPNKANAGGVDAGVQHVGDDANAGGSLYVQASCPQDQIQQFGSGGEHAKAVQLHGKVEQENEGEGIHNMGKQVEFVVQTPTHGRSASMKDACTEVSPSLSRRDMGTEMTPSASCPTSKCTSPTQNTSPARHNTPTRGTSPASMTRPQIGSKLGDDQGVDVSACKHSLNLLELASCHLAKLELRDLPSGSQASDKNSDVVSMNEWSPAMYSEEEMISNGARNDHGNEMDAGHMMKRFSVSGTRDAAVWEEAEKAKFNAKYKREEARINAWENLQKAKAEEELKKLEVRLEKLRSRATERVMSKLAAAERRAEEMRVAAEGQQAEQIKKGRGHGGHQGQAPIRFVIEVHSLSMMLHTLQFMIGTAPIVLRRFPFGSLLEWPYYDNYVHEAGCAKSSVYMKLDIVLRRFPFGS